MKKNFLSSILLLLLFNFAFINSTIARATSFSDKFSGQRPKELKNTADYVAMVQFFRYLNPDSALFYVNRGIAFADQIGDLAGHAALLNQYGMIEDNLGRFKESKVKYTEAEAIYRNLNDSLGIAKTLIRLGVVEKRKGNLNKAFELAVKSLKIGEAINNDFAILDGRLLIAEVYELLDDLLNAYKYINLAEEIVNKIPVNTLTFNFYADAANLFKRTKDFDKAILYLKKGISKINGNVAYNGHHASMLRQIGTIYRLKGEFLKSEKYLKDALTLSKNIKNVLRQMATMVELSDLYAEKNPTHSLKYLDEALKIAVVNKTHKQQVTILDRKCDVLKSMGDLAGALKAKEQSAQLSEKFFYKDVQRQVAYLEDAYESEKSRSMLLEEAREHQIVIYIYICIVIATFVVLIITFVYYRRARHLNKLLKKANTELASSNDVKDKFFSIVAHDIRSPLVSTIGILKLISDKDIDEETGVEMVKKLISHCENSLGILDKLLKWGQMQIKGVMLNRSIFNPITDIQRNVNLVAAAANRKGIEIVIEAKEGIFVDADADQFDFIIRNLLTNAVKFTPENGLVKITTYVDDSKRAIFKVSDNGVGISNERIEKLFELSAIGTNGTSAEKGTSLGLIICKEFVEANGGQIVLQSVLGKGTTFSFDLTAV